MFQHLKILLFLSLLLLSYQQQAQQAQQPKPAQQQQQAQQPQQAQTPQQQPFQQPVCVAGQNCPFGKGICVADYCKCNEGFYTLADQNLQPGQQQMYCNYVQKSLYQPLILELFLPGVGHISVGHYWLGALKILLLVTYFSLTYYLYGEFELPKLFIYLFEKFGFAVFLPRGGSSTLEKVLDMIRELSGIVLTLMYFADLFLYKMEVYTDGYGVPFA